MLQLVYKLSKSHIIYALIKFTKLTAHDQYHLI